MMVALMWMVPCLTWAANSVTTVSQVTGTTDVTTAVDYTVTSATPFATAGIVNIQETEHAVLILAAVKPSAAIPLLASHVQIDGAKAVNGQNCQVKLYNRGCIILPYGDSVKPLTVYDGQNFTGTSVNSFGLENSNGFMNTLTAAKLNNKIRSFKLKRGYMVTFSLRSGGYGYSRCFIAANADLEMASLPAEMDQKISSYRIFKWYDTGKQQLAAAAGDAAACSALNVTSTYGWGVGSNMLPDVECVPHHIKESWPSPSDLGKATYSPHMKTNNEPRNPSDEEPCDLNAILNNWEALMATGMRLCSPSSWDGSDYWNATGFLKDFFDAIDSRGWRCDIIDLHGYWLLSNFQTNVPNWYNAVKRPVWISEWVWGASWSGGSGAFVNGVTEAQNATNVQSIYNYLNGLGYVERYYYWNSERDPSRLYKNGNLTQAGQNYSQLNTGVGYKSNYDHVPKAVTRAPENLQANYNQSTGKTTLTWKELSGELSRTMTVERRKGSNGSWSAVSTVTIEENPTTYTYQDNDGGLGYQYRIHVVGFNGNDLYSNQVSIMNEQVVYLYNIGTRQWLTGTNNWGTQGSLTPHGGIDFTMLSDADGNAVFETGIMRDDNNHYLNKDGSSVWVDQVQGEWAVNQVGTSDGKPVYTIALNGSYLTSNGGGQALVFGSSTGTSAQWQLQTFSDRQAMLQQATYDNPVDATFMLKGPHFHQYDKRNSTWQGSPDIGGSAANRCAEKYNTTSFDVYQTTAASLPAGRYRLMVQGFYRNGGYANAATKHNNGTESLHAMLYAGSAKVPLQSIFTEAGKRSEGVTTSGISGKFPDSMGDASAYFTDGLYENDLQFSLTSAASLRIGISKSQGESSDWTIFDNFRLVYLGNLSTATVTAHTADGRHWATFYSSTNNYQLPNGATAYTATLSGNKLVLHEIGDIVPKGCAVIIVSPTAGQLTLTSTTATAVSSTSDNVLKGSDSDMPTSTYSAVCVMGSVAGKFGFHPYTHPAIPAERAFVVVNTNNARSLTLSFDETTTGVAPSPLVPTDAQPVYDLQGRRVTPSRKGIYLTPKNRTYGKAILY